LKMVPVPGKAYFAIIDIKYLHAGLEARFRFPIIYRFEGL
jgi:hypothetical protein